uniref:Uncharacterized protein n=1 Tax=Romanomermis culicivorax TaxID=13658 RepID=A0A915KLW7_ROMCU
MAARKACFYLLCLIINFWQLSKATTKCVVAVGKAHCETNATLASDLEVFLMDRDKFTPDDQIGWTTTDENGNFRVEGCGSDFLTHIDPYVKIFSYCNDPQGKFIKTHVERIFAPQILNFGEILLDDADW